MNIMSLLAMAAGLTTNPLRLYGNPQFRGATPSRRKGVNKSGLPSGYPGAKLARKAIMKQIAVKHPRGLRADGLTV